MISSSWPLTPTPGSMTTHCSPAAGASTQQLVAVASDGKPAMSTAEDSWVVEVMDEPPAYRGGALPSSPMARGRSGARPDGLSWRKCGIRTLPGTVHCPDQLEDRPRA